jgi:hypothetical protein
MEGPIDGSKKVLEWNGTNFSYCEPDKGIYNAMNKGILPKRISNAERVCLWYNDMLIVKHVRFSKASTLFMGM